MIKNNNCVTSYEGTASPGIVGNLDLGIVTSEEKGGWQKSEGRAIHVKGRVGFGSAWQASKGIRWHDVYGKVWVKKGKEGVCLQEKERKLDESV